MPLLQAEEDRRLAIFSVSVLTALSLYYIATSKLLGSPNSHIKGRLIGLIYRISAMKTIHVDIKLLSGF